MNSEYLNTIIDKRNQTTNLQLVFVDVKSYSKRRSQIQVEVVRAFMNALNEAKSEVSKDYLKFAQDNEVNFKTDIIVLPTGDGAAIGFPFEGLHDIHLSFAKSLLKAVATHNSKSKCEKFEEAGWCNCHASFKLKIGVDEGKGILYRDINGNYNIAGNVINMASRVMNQGDSGHIFMTENAYEQLIDMIDDPHLDERFRKYEGIKIKHGLEINVFQYINEGEPYINSQPPSDLVLAQRAKAAMTSLSKFGFPAPPAGGAESNKMAMVELMEKMGQIFSDASIIDIGKPKNTIEPRG